MCSGSLSLHFIGPFGASWTPDIIPGAFLLVISYLTINKSYKSCYHVIQIITHANIEIHWSWNTIFLIKCRRTFRERNERLNCFYWSRFKGHTDQINSDNFYTRSTDLSVAKDIWITPNPRICDAQNRRKRNQNKKSGLKKYHYNIQELNWWI